jgi:myo-inositol-1(or 4)-monophosphatase
MLHHSPIELQILLDLATEAATAAGAILLDLWDKLEDIQEKGGRFSN